ncbi:BtrH N-terminal domain-containing protein [Paenibacillus sp. JX-17]|uniref:BtrH N-terminal domain-containing protein n=1 Tax=Paenibacillus lacisoli TaxID=3064525 RepID=A0ABT9CDH3_9BACL|nr:BtrH N-terminal domain-containing protein [Paenibacillus sp. JX-17]MDO7907323.1 BtrH N-terminal domain-containing protein [Paenibacillus sp. JX-17]
MYIGNGAYCYANSTSMLLKAYGEEVQPGLLEVLTGVGIGFTWEPDGMPFLHSASGAPDTGISRALQVLGYSWQESACMDGETYPLEQLRTMIASGPVVLGPLDMGYLDYIPNHRYLGGCDHYVLAYRLDDEYVYVHDPAGYPYSRLTLAQLDLAWKGETIPYRRGTYRAWWMPERTASPTRDEVYEQTISFFQGLYEQAEEAGRARGAISGSAGLQKFRGVLLSGEVSEGLIGHMSHFLFQLGARRANDFAAYFEARHPELSALKVQQAELLGEAHGMTVRRDWQSLAELLEQFGRVEEAFQRELLSIQVTQV